MKSTARTVRSAFHGHAVQRCVLAQDGTILPLTITAAVVGLVWHTLPTLDIYTYAGLENTKAAFMDVATVPFGFGNPLDNNLGCNIENSRPPSARSPRSNRGEPAVATRRFWKIRRSTP